MLSNRELSDLASHLWRERLFITSEQQNLQILNEKMKEISTNLSQLAWISSYQRINLNHLILAKVDCLPALTCQRNYTINNMVFVDACKALGYQEAQAYGEFLTFLLNNVELVAKCLNAGEKLFPNLVPEIVYSLSCSLFGSCLLSKDKIIVLKLLQQLAAIQLVPSDNPRRMLRHGSCSFARFYSLFHENLNSAKLFLTATLHYPIMKLLMEDETFLDIDPDKAVIRFPVEERLKKFGVEGTPEYNEKLQKHRECIIKKLLNLTNNFIYSLRENLHCFPKSVSWLVRQMAGLFRKSGYLGEKEIYEICIDLVFTHFICPAVVNPEPYGITDVPIGYIARFNLMQVAQILQMLAVRKYQEVDAKVADLYNKFHTDCVSSFLDRILEDYSECLDEPPPSEQNTEIDGISRSAALFTHSQLNNLVKFFHSLLQSDSDSLDKRHLEALLSRLPNTCTNGYKTPMSKMQPEKSSGYNNINESSILKKSSVLLSKVNRQKNHSSNNYSNLASTNDDVDESKIEDECPQQILVLPLSGQDGEPIGLLSEQKVLEVEGKRQVDVISLGVKVDQNLGEPGVEQRGEGQEKRTRFSLSHDEGSIGNTSDNLEAVSEAASNHSGASSLESENEDQNDNLSDMVSANVSGRGTPNISGRDTPSSQITEGEEGRGGEEEIRGSANEHRQVVPSVSKQSRSDIDDKFGKFEIKKQEVLGDETKSLVSDTWSTDVLASDSETVEQSERNFPRPPEADGPPHPFIQHSFDISETASEAWSTDVLTSDSERLTEVDTDDTASVARSDDTAHSEFGVRGEADGGETPPPQSSVFRPIKESSGGRVSLAVPPSPTRADMWNVTGRGGVKSDYRRRTVEFVDSGLGRNFSKPIPNNLESSRMIHVIDKMDSPKIGGHSNNGLNKIGRSIFLSRSRSPQPSQSRHPSNGTENTVSESNSVPTDNIQKLSLDNCNLSVVEPDMSIQVLSDRNGEVNEGAVLFDDSDITPPSPLLSNTFPPSSLLPSNSVYLNNLKTEEAYALPYKFNDMKLKQEGDESERVFLSSTSLASTSSSGSNSGIASQPQSQTMRNVEKIPSATGAIPKSISFDKTAERGDKEYLDEEQKQRKGFFRNLKMSFKNRKIKHFKGDDLGRFDENMPSGSGGESYGVKRDIVEENGALNGDAIEDILAKYRNKPPAETEDLVPRDLMEKKLLEADEEEGFSDESLFINAKRKLRLVLCNSDLRIYNSGSVSEDQVVSFLKLQLAEAVNLQNRSLVSQLQETLRCVRLFDYEGCRRLFKSLKEDYQNRAPYIAYLVRSRQTLLSSIAHFERMIERIETDSRVCQKFLVALCVRIFLERREDLCSSFSKEFQQLSLPDEKTDLLDKFLMELSQQLERDHNWKGASEAQLEQAKSIIETAVISRVYPYALYPNGDVDRCRDHVLHEHMKKLASVITPNHKDLQIPKIFHVECPWPSAQAEISALAAYKTPKDKVSCICRCATTIMNLLSMAVDGNIPAADDFVPVLVFVLILANPPALLSTVQYVNSFYGSRLAGEEQYWWTQFASAIEFIKTMD
ncbi:hypothetical protein RUM44_012907 [Polyplax serrata]|uniref:GTPase-activating protein and VPS9 domain-containing protein 1 n=1 Tax=Polyplax serrata TaxID=468196 RepID=A0ABR1BHG3_POLSC